MTSDTTIDFFFEASRYAAVEFPKRSAEDLEFIFQTADRLSSNPEIRYWIVIPFYFRESFSDSYLDYLYQITTTRTDTCVVVFFNGSESDAHIEEFDPLLIAIRSLPFPKNRFSVIARKFGVDCAIGRIRGLITDAIIVAAHTLKCKNPFIIFNDSDTLAVDESYIDYMLAEADDCTKFVAGPVAFGYLHTQPIGLPIGMSFPELFIFNKINQAIKRLTRNGLINFEQRIWPDGANMMVSLALYCCVGGFDYWRTSGEDDALGRALHRYNPYHMASKRFMAMDDLYAGDPILQSKHIEQAWLATDPRRILLAICEGHDGTEAWQAIPFETIKGAEIRTSDLLRAYDQNDNLIRQSDLDQCRFSGSADIRKKVAERVFEIVLRAARNDIRIRNDEQVREFFLACGIPEFSKSYPDFGVLHFAKRWENPLICELYSLGNNCR